MTSQLPVLTEVRATRPSYDALQLGAVLVFRPCCQRWVYATKPDGPCVKCWGAA